MAASSQQRFLPAGWRDGSLALLAALATIALFALLERARPAYFLWDDNASENLPAFALAWRALTGEGVLAHLNLHQYLGQIWLGNGQSGVLYPPIYLAAGLASWVCGDLRWTIELLAIGHLALGAAGMVLLVRHHRVSATVALGVGLLYVTFPFLAQVSRNWIFVAFVAGLAPWSLLALTRVIETPSRGAALALGGVKALLFYQGNVNFAVMLALLEGVFLLAVLASRSSSSARPRDVLASCSGALLATAALAAPLLLPMLEAQQLSATRSTRLPFAEFFSNRLQLGVVSKAQLGWMVERAIHQSSGALFYFGLPCLVLLAALALPAVRRQRDSHVALGGALTAGCALVLGAGGVAVFYPLPLLSSFRWPFKYYLFFLLFAAIALGMGADALCRHGRSARTLALGLLAAGLAGNVLVLFAPRWDRAFGPNRVTEDVSALQRDIGATLPTLTEGRVVSLWQRHIDARTPRFLTHDWATLIGAYHLGGYDPLIARRNFELAMHLEYSNIFRYALDPRVLAYFDRWSVRTLIAPARDDYALRLARWPQLRLYYRDALLQVWENTTAWPVCSFREDPTAPVAYRWRTNGLTAEPGGRGGLLRFGVAPLPWWFVSIDGGPRQPASEGADQQVEVQVPAGTRKVELIYVDVPFRFGVAIAVAFLLFTVGAWSIGLLRRRRGPPPTHELPASKP